MMPGAYAELVEKRLRDINKSKRPIHSHHDGYGKILEEVDELWDEGKKKEKKRDPRLTVLELMDISALCQKMAEDLNLMGSMTAEELWEFKKKLG